MTIPGSAISLLASGAAPAGYAIERSLRFNGSSDSSYLNRTPSSAGNRRTWTWSGWVKRAKISGDNQPFLTANSSTGNSFFMGWHGFYNDGREDAIEFNNIAGTGDGYITTAVFRDPSAWYHVVIAFDSTQSSSGDRIKCYVNGVQQTWQQTSNGPGLNDQWKVNDTIAHTIGDTANSFTGQGKLDSYLADVNFIDGQALAPTDFGEFDTNGVWQPKAYVASGPNDGTTWSSATLSDGGSLSNLFDGSSSTSATQSTAGTVASVTGFGPLTVSSTVSFYSPDGGAIYTLNGGSSQSFASAGWHHISFSGSLTSFTWEGQSSTRIFLYMMAVDGVTLIDGDTSNIGVNGFHLDFSDNSSNAALGTDSSGNNNNWTVNNLVASVYTGTVQYGEDTGNSNFDSSATSLTYDTTGFSYSTVTSPKTDTGQANASTVLKTSDGTAIDWTFSTDATDRYIWTSSNGINWSSPGTLYDTDGGPKTVNAAWVAWAGGSNVSVLTVTFADESTIDSLFDSPANGVQTDTGLGGEVSGNYATLNPLDANSQASFANGNLDWTATNGNGVCRGTIAVSSGKWYFEFTYNEKPSGGGTGFGILEVSEAKDFIGASNAPDGYSYYSEGSSWTKKYNGGTATDYGNSFGPGDIIGVALDLDGGTITFYKNGTSQGQAFSGISGTYAPALTSGTSVGTARATFNAGQRAFAYTAPSGFKALCTANLPDPTIADGSDYMDVVTYAGTGTSLAVGDPVLSATADSGVVSASQIFNGSTSDGGYYNGTGTDITLTTSPFTINTSLRVYQNFRSDGTYAICLNSSCVNVPGTGTDSTAFRWSTVDLSTFTLPLSVTKLGYSLSQNSGNTIRAIEVDGTILINGAGQPVNFEPDFVWIKRRNGANAHALFDVIRGVTKVLESSNTGTEKTNDPPITSFDSNGFTVNGTYAQTNASGGTYVGWTWDAGTSNTSIAAGDYNNQFYNQDATWSSITTLSGGAVNASFPMTQGFDGDLSTRVEGDTSNEYAEFAINATIAAGGVEVYAAVTSSEPLVVNLYNGATNVETLTSGATGLIWHQTSSYAGAITKIRIQRTNRAFEWNAIKVNGKILVDTSVTPATQYPSIASTVRANPSAGFSIVSYTGDGSTSATTMGHGLNAQPGMIIVKDRDDALNWVVLHQSFTDRIGKLNLPDAFDTGYTSYGNGAFNPAGSTSTVFATYPGTSTNNFGNALNDKYIAYCFAPVEGYSAFGSYTGNGSTDGPFVFTGMRPRWILIKTSTRTGDHWVMHDSSRSPYNASDAVLFANLPDLENTAADRLDILSNGFKLRDTSGSYNANGDTYIYAAFAENPFKTARAR